MRYHAAWPLTGHPASCRFVQMLSVWDGGVRSASTSASFKQHKLVPDCLHWGEAATVTFKWCAKRTAARRSQGGERNATSGQIQQWLLPHIERLSTVLI